MVINGPSGMIQHGLPVSSLKVSGVFLTHSRQVLDPPLHFTVLRLIQTLLLLLTNIQEKLN